MSQETNVQELKAMTPQEMREACMEECGYPYKFSIVTAVYNVENVLEETIESVIGQDIGFEENVQLILVNDGSPDGSGQICDRYAQMYPDNIVVIHKENGGAASARNAGLEYATGKYLNFLDSDDTLQSDVLAKVYPFYERVYDQTDVVSIPIYICNGGTMSPHLTNWKFDKGSRVISLKRERQYICMNVASSFFKQERKQDICFDSHLVTAEDAKIVLTLLYPKMTLGVLANTKYLYRKTVGGGSLMQSCQTKKDWYFNVRPYFYQWAHDYYMEKCGYFPAFAQYMTLYDLMWRVLDNIDYDSVLTPEEQKRYREDIYQSLRLFDDQYLLQQKRWYRDQKYFAIAHKYERLEDLPTNSDMLQYAHNTKLFWQSSAITPIYFLDYKDGEFYIEGYSKVWGLKQPEEYKVFLKVNDDELIPCEPLEKDFSTYFANDMLSPGVGFKARVPISDQIDEYKFQIYTEVNNHLIVKLNIQMGRLAPITNELLESYYYSEGRILTYSKGVFYLKKANWKLRLRKELRYLKSLWNNHGRPGKKAVAARSMAHLVSPFIRKKIWIVTDRLNKAGDNGEALFEYLKNKRERNIHYYFAINKSSPDYERIKKGKHVLPFMGIRHKLYVLLGATVISSHADDFYVNPFQKFSKFYRDMLYRSRFVFLQHGITMNDLTNWLSYYKRNISLFVTATNAEYQSILSGYDYDDSVVKLTGFPRYDKLTSNPQKYITVMPTWRKYLASAFDVNKGAWSLINNFQESDYFRFYNSLINDERLLACAKKYNYTLCFVPHPSLHDAVDLFHRHENVRFIQDEPYNKIFAESNLVVTDYSSIMFDFAYLRKPLIYCQFDAETFFQGNHICTKGYFDHERDGFGEVEYTLEGTIDRMIEYIENDCQLKDKYRERIENTFAYNDRNNCQRVYDSIMALERGQAAEYHPHKLERQLEQKERQLLHHGG